MISLPFKLLFFYSGQERMSIWADTVNWVGNFFTIYSNDRIR